MVEKDNETNSSIEGEGNGSDADRQERRRGRLFGVRKSGRRAEHPGAAEQVTADAAANGREHVGDAAVQDENPAGQNVAEQNVAEQAFGQQADERNVAEQASGQQAEERNVATPEQPPVPEQAQQPARPPRPATSILFQAPQIAPLPPLPYNDSDDDDDEENPSVRRRTRRRSDRSTSDNREGRDTRDTRDDERETTTRSRRTREPREPELITEPQRIKGSTRLEAKKQRRRDGRDAGRRRPVITEAEFLARRESVDRTMVVREKDGRIQIGVLEDSVLVEHYVAKSQEASLIGNVYLGRVQNVLPSMEAAFVDIGRGRNAVLYSGEVDWDAAAENSSEGKSQARRIELALKPGDRVLVQVTKDPVGHKGARLTSQVSLPGRYLVYVPNGSMNGISRKLPDTERARLKKILKEVLPENVGVIVRTAAEGATDEQLALDVNRLIAQWASISQKAESEQAPAMLHSEPDLLIKIVRDVFNEDFHTLVIEGDGARETIETYLAQVAPDLLERVQRYEGSKDSFDEFRITEQIEKALDRKVWLPSGGSLVIDRTEAMTVVDVNTGKFVGSGGNLEETVTKNNLEAAEEIVRQLRLRDIGGIIVVDFIDMVLETNRDLVLRRLVECLSRDRTKHQVAEVTSLGLVQMTRKKLGLGLLETFSESCEVCAGRGVVVHHDPVTKHRQTAQPPIERRRGKSGNGNGGTSPAPTVAPHAITEDVKNALAQIAASTLAAHAAGEPAPAADVKGVAPEVAAQVVAEMTAQSQDNHADNQAQGGQSQGNSNGSGEGGSRARGRRSRSNGSQRDRKPDARDSRSDRSARDSAVPATEHDGETRPQQAAPSEGASSEPSRQSDQPEQPRRSTSSPTVPAVEQVAILDIPITVPARAKHRVPSSEAEHLLDSVLEALPAPKQPGQGRNRNRRVTTAALSGGMIAGDPSASERTE